MDVQFIDENTVKINGVFISDKLISSLDYLQTGGTSSYAKPVLDNSGITDKLNDLTELNNYFIEIIAMASLSEDTNREVKMLENLHWIRETIQDFSVPKKLRSK